MVHCLIFTVENSQSVAHFFPQVKQKGGFFCMLELLFIELEQVFAVVEDFQLAGDFSHRLGVVFLIEQQELDQRLGLLFTRSEQLCQLLDQRWRIQIRILPHPLMQIAFLL